MPSFAEICTSRSRLLLRSSWLVGCQSLKRGAGGRVCPRRSCRILLNSVVKLPRRGSTRALSFGPAASRGSGPSGFRRPTSDRRGPGLEIQRPQCAFYTSMLLRPALHMSTRNLLLSSSTHEPSDPPFRVMSNFCFIIIGQVRSTFVAGASACDH